MDSLTIKEKKIQKKKEEKIWIDSSKQMNPTVAPTSPKKTKPKSCESLNFRRGIQIPLR
jgi:hypothetical protein